MLKEAGVLGPGGLEELLVSTLVHLYGGTVGGRWSDGSGAQGSTGSDPDEAVIEAPGCFIKVL